MVVEKNAANADNELRRIERRINAIKRALPTLGDMRPGSLTRQYQKPKAQAGAYYQISFTHKMRSRTEYVLPEHVAKLKKEIMTFRRFKKLIAEWTELAIRQSSLRVKTANAERSS